MADTSTQEDWTKTKAIALPKEGYFELEQGRYGPVFPKTPACYGFSVIGKLIPGREQAFYDHAQAMVKRLDEDPHLLDVLKLHYARWLLFIINGETYMMYQAIFDTDFDKYTEDAVAIFNSTGLNTVFMNLEGWPEDWRTNPGACVKFFRDHHWPSFLEIGAYPYVSADEVRKALTIKAAFGDMLNQMQ
jgi:hypothetical protein